MAEKTPPPNKAGPTSPTKWKEPKQYSRDQNLGKPGAHAERDVIRTPSGHTLQFIDTADGEVLSVAHRGGAGLQIGPSGDVKFTSHNGQYTVVFGENRMEITGTQDVTVRGGGTLKVDGDYDVTVGGNMNMTCDNDFNFKGKGFNVAATGNMDMVGKNMTVKTEGSMAVHAGGTAAITSKGGASLMSNGDSVSIAGATQVGIVAAGGEVAVQSGGSTHIKAAAIHMDGPGDIRMNEGSAQAATDLVTVTKANKPTQQSRRTGNRHA